MEEITVRPAHGEAAADTVITLIDAAIDWLVSIGRADQWGTGPAAANPRWMARARDWATADDGLYFANIEDQPVGALVVGTAPDYVPRAVEPELYIDLLVTDRAYAGRGIGAHLLSHAADLAVRKGATLLRADCYAGGDGALVRYYERQGFTCAETFSVELPTNVWPGQVLQRQLAR